MLSVNIETPDWLPEMESILEELSEGVVIVDDELRVVFAKSTRRALWPKLPAVAGRLWTFLRVLASRAALRERTRELASLKGLELPVLSAALYQRFSSRGEAEYQDKVLSAMRYGFGGHLKKVAGK